MRGAIHPLPSTPSWRGTQLKHRDNFTFTFNGWYYSVRKLSSPRLLYKTPASLVLKSAGLKPDILLWARNKLQVFPNEVLRKIAEPEKVEVHELVKALRNTQLGDVYTSPGVVRLVKSRRIQWSGHAASMCGKE
jgi:hypothetical protein